MGSESFEQTGEQPKAAPPPHIGAGDELDLSGISGAIARRKRAIAVTTIGSFLAAVAFILVVKPTYTADSRVLIENQESYFTQPEKSGTAALAPDSEAVASQVQMITSRDLARQAIIGLGLKGNPEFDPLAGGQGSVNRILMMLGLLPSLRQLAPEDRILEYYSKRLYVYTFPKSRVVNIQFSAKDPKLAARGANMIADLYIGIQKKAKQEQARLAAVSLGRLNADLRSKLAVAESRVEEFRARTGLMMGANNALVPSQQLAEINTQLAAARTSMADTQAKGKLIRAMIRAGRLGEVTDVAKDDLVRRIAGQRSTLRSQIALESRTLGPAHPRIKELRAQLASVDNELRSVALKTARALENDARIAKVRVENLQAAIASQQQKVGATSVDQVKLRELELEAKLVRGQLEGNLNKYREALARQHSVSTPGDARIISRANEPQLPSFPKKLPVLIFATLAGLILSLGWVVARELLSDRAFVPGHRGLSYEHGYAAGRNHRGVPDLPRQVTGAPVAVANDAIESPANTAPVQDEPPPSDERAMNPGQCRIAAHIDALDTTGYGRRILVCPESGRADHAAGIEPVARALSAHKRVILVDLSGRLESDGAGLADLLDGYSSFGEVIERDPGSRLHVISRGWGMPEIGTDLDSVLDALSQTYDIVLLVAPEGDDIEAALRLAPAADLALIGAASGVPGERVANLRRELLEHGAGAVAIWTAAREGETGSWDRDRSDRLDHAEAAA